MRSLFLALATIAGTLAVSGGAHAAPVALQPPALASIVATPVATLGQDESVQASPAHVETVQYYRRHRRHRHRRYYR